VELISNPNTQENQARGLTLLFGGARSGKSSLAVELATKSTKPVFFVATAQALDDDMRDRISRHKAERPGWSTIEEPLDLCSAINKCPDQSFVIIDCLTLWISNMLLADNTEASMRTASTRALGAITERAGSTVAISNEVGLGIVPDNPLARQYRDILGRTNQQWARASATSLFLVAGKAIQLHNPQELLT
jgi:adenosyl cobinamide kinase/adenosyl cobinamide phosphate guanylyltransferase